MTTKNPTTKKPNHYAFNFSNLQHDDTEKPKEKVSQNLDSKLVKLIMELLSNNTQGSNKPSIVLLMINQ